MLITSKTQMEAFHTCHRVWHGIPGIARTKNGRTFISLYSGQTCETYGNYAILLKSDTDSDFGDPIAIVKKEGDFRCFDPVVWIDPLDRLWFIWNVMPGEAVYASICENPDADELIWSEEFYIGRGIMMNKPTVLTNGDWLFPIALWQKELLATLRVSDLKETDIPGSYVYKTSDNGKTFIPLGMADVPNRAFDEHMVLELTDGKLMMLVRTYDGIGVSYSCDGGSSWSAGEKSNIGGPSSRFFIGRLRSGRVLLINHYNFNGRNNLTALLSEDDGKTFPYSLLLDERNDVSYPDVTEGSDGYIYVVYDRERGGFKKSLEEAYACAREILTAKFTEEDIIAGTLKTKGSFVKNVVTKLDRLAPEDPDPYYEAMRKTIIQKVLDKKIIAIVRGVYGEDCLNLAEALHKGGVEMMEVTFDQSNPAAFSRTSDTIAALVEKMGDKMVIGAGTVTSLETLELAKKAGAKFIVSPDTNAEVIKATVAAGMVSMPGAMTPTEIVTAHGLGADFVKVFPTSGLGASYIKAVCAPLNHIRLLAVGGVSEKNVAEFLKAGCVGAGVGGNLVNKQWIQNGEFDKITALAQELIANANQ